MLFCYSRQDVDKCYESNVCCVWHLEETLKKKVGRIRVKTGKSIFKPTTEPPGVNFLYLSTSKQQTKKGKQADTIVR